MCKLGNIIVVKEFRNEHDKNFKKNGIGQFFCNNFEFR